MLAAFRKKWPARWPLHMLAAAGHSLHEMETQWTIYHVFAQLDAERLYARIKPSVRLSL